MFLKMGNIGVIKLTTDYGNDFMEEINKETQAMLKQISIRKAEKKANATKRIAELKKLIKFWEQDL